METQKRRFWPVIIMLFTSMSIIFYGCKDDENEESAEDYAGYEDLDVSICDPTEGTFTLEINNEYFPLPVGRELVLEGEEDGEELRVEITVLNETIEIAGVECRIVEEAEYEDQELIEVSRNFYVQAADGTVCYFGEDVDIYEDGEITSHDGQWQAGQEQNMPGIMMPGAPQVGTKFAQETAPGIAEDMSAITNLGETVTVPAGTYLHTLRAFDWNPLDPGDGDTKYYAKDVGPIVDDVVKLISINDNL